MNFKRSLSLIFAVMVILLCFPTGVFAASASNPMNTTYVMNDLNAMGYDTANYYKDSSADYISLIDFTEYGYDYQGDMRYYGLYLYVYNPSGNAIQGSGNTVEIAYTDKSNKKSGTLKYPLEILSVSSDTNYENVLYKFRVIATEDMARKIMRSARTYEVSSVELRFDGASGAKSKSFVIGGKYVFTGYQKNFGINSDDKDTLACTYSKFDVISIELHSASWFTDTSDLGEDYRYEVSSVYFNIPDYFIEKYGNLDDEPKDGGTSGLYSVKGSYYKYVTDGLLVMDEEWYNKFYYYIDADLWGVSSYDHYTIGEGGVGFYNDYIFSVDNGSNFYEYDLTYDMYVGTYSYGLWSYDYYSSQDINNHICNLLLNNNDRAAYVNQKTFLESYNKQGRNHYTDTGGLSERNSNVFKNISPSLQYYEIFADGESLNSSIKSFADKNVGGKAFNWLHKLFNGDLYTDADGYADIRPIIELTSNSFIAGDGGDDDIANKLFVMSENVQELKTFYSDMSSDNHVYLMRFDVNPYYCPQVTLTTDVIKGHGKNVSSGTGYYFEKAIYEDFDILEFTFMDSGKGYHTVPVSCSPIDIVGSVIPGNNTIQNNPNNPDGSGSNGFFDENPVLKAILAVLVIILILVLVWFVSKPFLAIVKGIGNAKDRRYKNYDVKMQMKEDKREERNERKKNRVKRKKKITKRKNKIKKFFKDMKEEAAEQSKKQYGETNRKNEKDT